MIIFGDRMIIFGYRLYLLFSGGSEPSLARVDDGRTVKNDEERRTDAKESGEVN
jgi:hypothetical protein